MVSLLVSSLPHNRREKEWTRGKDQKKINRNAAERDIKMEILGERLRIVVGRIKVCNTFLLEL